MSVHDATVSRPSTNAECVHLRVDPYCGRKYHASTALPENTDLLGPCVPYSYTIYKRFRNEVCAECWRYDGGRRFFLKRRDDEGYANLTGENGADEPQNRNSGQASHASSTGAGLRFCDARCQRSWIGREGIDTVDMLRRLEEARRKKKAKAKPEPEGDAQQTKREMLTEVVAQAWDALRERERSPKEVRKWRDLQLDDYETDMARYVLLALLRYRRECCTSWAASQLKTSAAALEVQEGTEASAEEGYEHGLEWQGFVSLQANELALLRECPEILEHHTRIYQLLKGRFGSDAAYSVCPSNSRSPSKAAPSPNGKQSAVLPQRQTDNGSDGWSGAGLRDVVTIGNVRTILGVDPGNSFGIWEEPVMEESECLGFAVYPAPSLFNHHCCPNVRKQREGRTQRFVTTIDVEEGTELCISYVSMRGTSNWRQRQKELLNGWYFRCRCGRCKTEEESGTVCRSAER